MSLPPKINYKNEEFIRHKILNGSITSGLPVNARSNRPNCHQSNMHENYHKTDACALSNDYNPTNIVQRQLSSSIISYHSKLITMTILNIVIFSLTQMKRAY